MCQCTQDIKTYKKMYSSFLPTPPFYEVQILRRSSVKRKLLPVHWFQSYRKIRKLKTSRHHRLEGTWVSCEISFMIFLYSSKKKIDEKESTAVWYHEDDDRDTADFSWLSCRHFSDLNFFSKNKTKKFERSRIGSRNGWH